MYPLHSGDGKPAYEDGTNIALSTPYRAEFTHSVLPWYNPVDSKPTTNWKDKWVTLRTRFERLIDKYCSVECILIQRQIPAYGLEHNDLPPNVRHQTAILICNGLRSEPAKLFKADGSQLKGLFPVNSIQGKPMLDANGNFLPFRFGVSRQFFVQPTIGWSGEFDSLPVPGLVEFARDATSLLYQLPPEIALTLWGNWPTGFSRQENSGESLWLDALFELSWQHQPASPLYSRRNAWRENFSVQLLGNGLFPRLPAFMSGQPSSPILHEFGYPLASYAKLGDVARASVAAIDEILEREKALLSASGKRFKVGLSFPGEHRPFVEQVAGRLANQVGKSRILYDKFHEAEFAQPDLDVYLPNLYRTECDLIAVFLCAEYKKKRWCKLEWRSIRQLIATTDAGRIMFLSFDDIGAVPDLGIFDGDGYVSIGNRGANEITKLIVQRIQQTNPGAS